jgi:hypothetical protein
MPKFIIQQTDRYEIEADTIEDAQIYWRNELLTGISIYNEFLDSSTVYLDPKDVNNCVVKREKTNDTHR